MQLGVTAAATRASSRATAPGVRGSACARRYVGPAAVPVVRGVRPRLRCESESSKCRELGGSDAREWALHAQATVAECVGRKLLRSRALLAGSAGRVPVQPAANDNAAEKEKEKNFLEAQEKDSRGGRHEGVRRVCSASTQATAQLSVPARGSAPPRTVPAGEKMTRPARGRQWSGRHRKEFQRLRTLLFSSPQRDAA